MLRLAFKSITNLWKAARVEPQTPAADPAQCAVDAFTLLQEGDSAGAHALLAPAFAEHPDNADLLMVQGLIYKTKGELAAAAVFLRKAIAARDGFAAAWAQLGSVLKEDGKFEQGLAALEQAAALEPQSAVLHQNVGMARYHLRDVPGAIVSLTTAVGLAPDMTEARFDLAEALLAAGDFERGWAEYEYRPHLAAAMNAVPLPRWDLHTIGKRVAVVAEQGLGDMLLFARLLARLRQHTSSIALFVPPELIALFRQSKLADEVRALSEITTVRRADYDGYIPFMSLAHLLLLEPEHIAENIPYLDVDEERRAMWRHRLGPGGARVRVGLAWAGNAAHKRDFDRSISIAAFAPLSHIDGIKLYQLQMGRSDLGLPEFPMVDLTPELHDFADTAALVEQLDVVISVDTAVAHVAGALGRPTWVLCPFRADWRWEIAAKATPWYPSARVFRPHQIAQWGPPIARLAEELRVLRAAR